MSLKGTRTERNLLTAFAGESQARNRYTFFASQAKKEGYEQIAAFFLETADNEKEHAKRLFKFLEGGGAAGENYEHTIMYPEFAKIAAEEGFMEIAAVLKAIAIAEEAHEKRYLKLLENIEQGKVFSREEKVRWKCRNCGYIFEETAAPEICPACAHPQAYFELWGANY